MPLTIFEIRRRILERKMIGIEKEKAGAPRKWYRGYCRWCGKDRGIFAGDDLCWPCDREKIEMDAYQLRKTHDPKFQDGD